MRVQDHVVAAGPEVADILRPDVEVCIALPQGAATRLPLDKVTDIGAAGVEAGIQQEFPIEEVDDGLVNLYLVPVDTERGCI